MKTLLINSFQTFKRYIINWKSKQTTVDWFAYLSFWIGIIFGLLFIKFFELTGPCYALIILSIVIGAVFEGIYFAFYLVIKYFLIKDF